MQRIKFPESCTDWKSVMSQITWTKIKSVCSVKVNDNKLNFNDVDAGVKNVKSLHKIAS